MSIYKELLAAGLEIDHRYSDLYVKDTPEARQIIASSKTRVKCSRFFCEREREFWLELSFQYDPFWQSKVNQSVAGHGNVQVRERAD